MTYIRQKKSLGQNFLVDQNTARKIVDYSGISAEDNVIEVGAGTGGLTKFLLDKTKNLTCIEIDRRAAKILADEFPSLNIINEDILKTDISKLFQSDKNYKLIGNLPYYISTQIIFLALENSNYFDSFTFLIQKELADRIVSEPNCKEYGILTLAIQMCGSAEKLFKIPRTVFKPRPKVESALVKINFQGGQFNKDLLLFIKAAFGNRRKKLSNSIASYFTDREKYKEFIRSNDLSDKYKDMLNLRAENLTLDDFSELHKYLKTNLID